MVQRDGYTPADLLQKETQRNSADIEGANRKENEVIRKKKNRKQEKKKFTGQSKKKEPYPIYICSCSTQGAPAICERFFISYASKAAISVSQAWLD